MMRSEGAEGMRERRRGSLSYSEAIKRCFLAGCSVSVSAVGSAGVSGFGVSADVPDG